MQCPKKPIKINGLKEIAEKYSTFFFDLDGVVWIGEDEVKGAIKSLEYIRSLNKKMFYVTNNGTRNRAEVRRKFVKHGFDVKEEEIYCAPYLTGLYLKDKYPTVENVMVGGTKSLAKQIQSFGYKVTHFETVDSTASFKQIVGWKLDQNIEALVVGFDSNFTINKMAVYSMYLQKGVKFLGTNPDRNTMREGFKVPGCGSLIAAIQSASGVKAEIVGKPNQFAIDFIIRENKLNRSDCVMIGDNLETDILFGLNGGIDTVCTLSGVSTEKHVLENSIAYPLYYSETI